MEVRVALPEGAAVGPHKDGPAIITIRVAVGPEDVHQLVIVSAIHDMALVRIGSPDARPLFQRVAVIPRPVNRELLWVHHTGEFGGVGFSGLWR